MPEPPKIIKEIRKSVELRPPPELARPEGIDLTEWDMYDVRVELYISYTCFQKMIAHAMARMGEQEEVMGLLLGDVFQWKGNMYTVAEDTVVADTPDSTATSVRFGSQGLNEVARALDEVDYEYLIVGWYHSHPGFTTFLSEKDLETLNRNFSKPYHATIVIDPVNRQFRSYKVVEDRYTEKRYALYEQSPVERELTEKRKKEILASIDELVHRQAALDGRPGPPAAPGEGNLPAERTLLPEGVRQTIETDIQRMIEERRKAEKKE